MISVYLTIFAFAMMGCVLATPLVTWIATHVGAIDRPDHFRRIHQGAIPRLGGLALAIGVATATLWTHLDESLRLRAVGVGTFAWNDLLPVLIAALVILVVGFVDDTRSLGPRMKLCGQALAVLTLYLGGIRIQSIEVLSLNINLGFPAVPLRLLGFPGDLPLPSLLVTLFWFLGCMNVWNLIDGMDGLASGVGLLVSGTLTLVAMHNENFGVAVLSVALAGSLAGFLLYNWHPACIFLGDSGSMLIGLLIGVIGVRGSMEGPSAISILFPLLAMGLPISDTAMAIFRRWLRNLPLSAADRRHVHHLLIGLGLNPRQAALMLYCFSGFLCGVVMLGVALRNEYLTLVLGISGCLAFLLVVTSRRDELANLYDDFQDRLARGRQERQAAQLTWEGIQRIELCTTATAAREIVYQAAGALGCELVRITCGGPDSPAPTEWDEQPMASPAVSWPAAIFRLSGGQSRWITVSLGLPADAPLAADIVFRSMHRLVGALAARLEWLQVAESAGSRLEAAMTGPAGPQDRPAAAERPAGRSTPARSGAEPLTSPGPPARR
ncbi:MAG TPA: MraY family glycosyltransferase [Isosphaeraceae bacterium]|nr:MraY family glycosyltransferase [Isosphaeraceae bacterium]